MKPRRARYDISLRTWGLGLGLRWGRKGEAQGDHSHWIELWIRFLPALLVLEWWIPKRGRR